MTRNLADWDRLFRVILGALLIAMALTCPWAKAQGAPLIYGLWIVGGVLIATGAVSFCPLYRLFGVRTCP